MASAPEIYIIAGPNGAGKTTFALDYLPKVCGSLTFVNADLIASGLSPIEPEKAAIQAGRVMLDQIHTNVAKGISFAFETTLSGLSYTRLIPQWQSQGYRVLILYLSLPTVELALDRVAARVRQGGHSITEDVLRRRFVISHHNFHHRYKYLADKWFLYDNSGNRPVLLDKGGKT